MSNNKKQTKKDTSVLLGIPDGDIEVDNDAYITKLGGLPVSDLTAYKDRMALIANIGMA
jgi:hypothetical protein